MTVYDQKQKEEDIVFLSALLNQKKIKLGSKDKAFENKVLNKMNIDGNSLKRKLREKERASATVTSFDFACVFTDGQQQTPNNEEDKNGNNDDGKDSDFQCTV